VRSLRFLQVTFAIVDPALRAYAAFVKKGVNYAHCCCRREKN
jgi:hypothetical protein